jgi:exosortase
MLAKTDFKEKHLLVGGLALLSTIFLCYSQILFEMAKRWTVDPNYSHGFLIPLLSGYLIWTKRDAFSLSAIDPELKGLPIFMFGLLLLVLGKAGTIDFVMRFSFLMVLVGLSLFLLGTNIIKAALFPLCYLVFMIPLPSVLYNDLTFRLKLLTSILSTRILSLIGIHAFREGNIIHLNQTSLQVIDACSGLHSLISLLALAVLFAYLTQKSIWKRLSLILLTIPITIFSNSCRLTVTAILVDHIGPQATEGFFHILTGIIMFVIALLLLVSCGAFIKRFR